MYNFCGIDPGINGAIAILDFQKHLMHLWDTPVTLTHTGDKIRKRVDPKGAADALCTFPIDKALIEKVHSTPNDGHVGAFTFGKATGLMIGLLEGLDIPWWEVSPGKWKKDLRVPSDKELSKDRASQLFPHCVNAWKLKKDHDRSEAALLALYAALAENVEITAPFQIGTINGRTI